jgi:hypothetical protein
MATATVRDTQTENGAGNKSATEVMKRLQSSGTWDDERLYSCQVRESVAWKYFVCLSFFVFLQSSCRVFSFRLLSNVKTTVCLEWSNWGNSNNNIVWTRL